MAVISSKTEACITLAVLVGLCIAARTVSAEGSIEDHLELNWGLGSVSADGQVISLTLNRTSGSGFRSKDTYMYARTDLQMKLVPNNSAGTVTTCYANIYTLHTNIYTNGTGRKEQQFRLWFDPTADFHTYSIVWTSRHILMVVDGTPIREFRNHENRDVAYPSKQPMRLYGSLWDADWATQGGRVQTDWSAAPFVAQYRNFNATTSSPGGGYYYDQEMDGTARQDMERARDKYMIYNYCTDKTRFPNGAPPECSMP